MGLTLVDPTVSRLLAVGGLGPWGAISLLAFVAFATLLGGCGRLFRARVPMRGRRPGLYRPDPRRPMYQMELRWHAPSGALWGALSLVAVVVPSLMAQWTPGWLAVVLALVAPPAAFALARACERWRDSPLTPVQLAVGWLGWGAMTALVAAIERRSASEAALAALALGANGDVFRRGGSELWLVALAGACSLSYALVTADPRGGAASD